MTFLCLTLTPLFCKKTGRWCAVAFAESHLPPCPSTIRFARRVVPCNRTIPAERPGVFDVLICCQRMKWHQWKPFQGIHLSCCHGLFFFAPDPLPGQQREAGKHVCLWWATALPPKGVGDFWMLKGIRKIPVHKTWTKYVVDRDWFRVPAGTPGPDGLKACVSVCQMLQPGQKVKGFTPKKRHQAAWTYGKFLSKKLVKKLLDY